MNQNKLTTEEIKSRIKENLIIAQKNRSHEEKLNAIIPEKPGIIDKIINYGISRKSTILQVPLVNRFAKRVYHYLNEVNRVRYKEYNNKGKD